MGALGGTLCFLPVGPDRKSSLLKAKRQSSCRGEDGKNGELEAHKLLPSL